MKDKIDKRKIKITFVYPGIVVSGFNTFKTKTNTGSWIIHGISGIAAYIKKYGYTNVDLIDMRQLKDWDEFIDDVKRKKPDVVGISVMSVDYNPTVEAIKIIKKVSPKTIVVIGGVHATLVPEDFDKNKNVDFIIKAEAEVTFKEMLDSIVENKKFPRITEGKRINLDELPFDDRELFDLKFSTSAPFKSHPKLEIPFFTINATRGCMYNCNFCQPAERRMFGNIVRKRSVKNVIKELKILRDKYGMKSVMFHDDCFIQDRKWILEFCKEYKNNGFDQSFVCQGRADLICRNEDLIERLASVGLVLMLVGFESGSQRVLNFLRKGTTVEQNRKAARILKKHGINILGNFMLGIPTETKEEMLMTKELIDFIDPFYVSIGNYTPVPGTDLYDYCKENNLIIMENYESFDRSFKHFVPKIKGIDYTTARRIANKYKRGSMLSRIYNDPSLDLIRPFLDKIRPLLRL